jgi:hypothetical protein
VAQAAVRIVIEPLFEASFRPGSDGFRPKRGARQAIYDIRKWVTYGYDEVIDLDVKSYFDTIDHELLMKLVQIAAYMVAAFFLCWLYDRLVPPLFPMHFCEPTQ